MLRPQKGNLGVSFNDTLLSFGLCAIEVSTTSIAQSLVYDKYLRNVNCKHR